MDPVILQKQIRDNTEDLQNYIRDLQNWEGDMKRKELELQNNACGEQSFPPVRSKLKKSSTKKASNKDVAKPKPKRIAAYDYASWDKFDVDKACEEIEKEKNKGNVMAESEDEIVEDSRLKEEAMYEKDRGNEYVKRQMWHEAMQCYSRSIECDPHNAIFYANRALCHLKTKDMRSAEADCTCALQLDGNYVKAFQRRAAARTELAQFQEARSDLLKVLELEPQNSASKAELNKLDAKISKQVSLMLSVKADKSNLVSDGNLTTIKQNNNTKSTITVERNEDLTSETIQISPKSWVTSDDVKLVNIIHKPPHLRSKKPLKRIEIQEIDNNVSFKPSIGKKEKAGGFIKEGLDNTRKAEAHNANETNNAQSIPIVRPKGKVCNTDVNAVLLTDDLKLRRALQLNRIESDLSKSEYIMEAKASEKCTGVLQVPPVPTSSIQFYVDWKKVKVNPELRYCYLKQIPGAQFSKIFKDSLESYILSSIMGVLEKEFIQRGEPVYPYLLGLSDVRRFRTLTMFLSSQEKKGIKKLIEYCEEIGECSKEEATQLQHKYEL